MKLIISENQYRRLLERKNSKTIIVTESQYNKLINEQFSPIRVPYEVRSKLTPILKSLLLSVSVIYMNNKLKGGVKEVDLENENVKLSISGENIDKELFGELDNPNYNFEIKNLEISDEGGEKTLNVDYKDRGDREDVIYVPPKTFDVDNIITIIRNETNLQKNNVQKPETLDTLVRNTLEDKYGDFYGKVKKDGKFIRYCFPHMHWGTDIGGDGDSGNIIYFKGPFKVINVGNECFIIDSLDGKYHKFCHSNNVFVKKDEIKGEIMDVLFPNLFGKKYYKIGDVGTKGDVTAAHIHYEIGTGVKGSKLTGQYNPSGKWENYWGVIKPKNPLYIDETIDSSEFITNKYDIKDLENYGYRIFSKDGKLCKEYKEKYK